MLRTVLSGILAVAVTASLQAQTCFDLNVGTNLNMADDANSAALTLGFPFTFNGVVYTQICVCSNGYIWMGPTGAAADWSPTIGELTAGAPRICPWWGDFNCAAVGSGDIYFNNTVPGQATVTWANVYEFNRTTPISMQVVFDAGSNIRITYGANAPLGGTASGATAGIIGASPGGGAVANPVTFAPRPLSITQNTFHQDFPAPPVFPYTGVSMLWSPTLPGYGVSDVVCVPNQLPPPANFEVVGTGCPQGAVLPVVPATDDSTHSFALPFAFPHASGPYNNIYVSSNGFVTLGATDPFAGCCSGNVATMLAGSPRIAAFWQDLYVPGGGQITAGLNAVSGDYEINWKGVPEYNLTTPGNTFQVALSPSGNIAIRYGQVQMLNVGRVALCGYSNGMGALDPGPSDLSALGALSVDTFYETFLNPGTPVDVSGLNFLMIPNGSGGYIVVPGGAGSITSPLAIAAAPGDVPNLGANFTTNVSGIAPSPNGNIVILLLSTEIPAFDLTVLNMPGCNAYIALPEFMSFLNFTFGSPTTTFPIFVPLDSALGGVQIMTQAVSDDLSANPFGWRASNGGRWTIGL